MFAGRSVGTTTLGEDGAATIDLTPTLSDARANASLVVRYAVADQAGPPLERRLSELVSVRAIIVALLQL